jgi:hypothetical protein
MHNQEVRHILRFAAVASTAFVVTLLLANQIAKGQQGTGRPGSVGAPDGPPVLSPQERATHYQAGSPWDGKARGRGSWNKQELDDFAEFPLFWLGESFAGYHLQLVERMKYPAGTGHPSTRGANFVAYTYGTCDSSAGRCVAPVTVIVEPGCHVRPDMIAERAKAGSLEVVRGGARMLRFADGHVRLWTGRVTIYISVAADPSLVDQGVQSIRGVGRLNNMLRSDQPLTDADFGYSIC